MNREDVAKDLAVENNEVLRGRLEQAEALLKRAAEICTFNTPDEIVVLDIEAFLASQQGEQVKHPEQALAAAPADDRIYVAYPRAWDGNCLIWFGRNAGIRSNLADALTWSLAHTEGFTARGYLPWPKSYIDQVARPVAVAATLDHKQALRSVGLKLPKLKRQPTRRRRDILNCSGCGRFLTERQRFDDCPNCGARNAP